MRPRLLAAAALLAVASPAFAQDYRLPAAAPPVDPQAATRAAAWRWEGTYLALSAVDTVMTARCLNQGWCIEGNPLLGKHPSTAKLIAVKAATGAIHFGLFRYTLDRNPRSALRMAQVGVALQGGVVLLNLRTTFK